MTADSAFVYMCVINATTWIASDHKQALVWSSVWLVMGGLGLLKQFFAKGGSQ